MIGKNRECSECGSEMLLDRVVEKGGEKTFYYACVNKDCKEVGKSFTPSGKETKSTIINRE